MRLAGDEEPSSLELSIGTVLQPPRADHGIAVGAYVHANGQYAPGTMDWYTALVGRKPAVLMWYQDWIHWCDFPVTSMDSVRVRGAMPMVTWEPWDNALGTAAQPAFRLSSIARGESDGHIRRWAKQARDWGHPLYLRFAHEMNGGWYPWGTQPGNLLGNAPADYVDAWRHVYEVFAEAGATNVRWVWSPNIIYPGAAPLADVYPGDAYVDWVGLDGYNTETAGGGHWRSMAALFTPSYDTLSALTGKPMLIAETASSERGGNKAEWITEAFTHDIPSRLPRVRAVIWFDENKEDAWSVTSSLSALNAYRNAIALPRYHGRLP
jgi:beta-mannanase